MIRIPILIDNKECYAVYFPDEDKIAEIAIYDAHSPEWSLVNLSAPGAFDRHYVFDGWARINSFEEYKREVLSYVKTENQF